MATTEIIDLEELLAPSDVARMLKVKLPTVYSWKARGVLGHVQLGGCVRFRRQDVREFIEAGLRAATRVPKGMRVP